MWHECNHIVFNRSLNETLGFVCLSFSLVLKSGICLKRSPQTGCVYCCVSRLFFLAKTIHFSYGDADKIPYHVVNKRPKASSPNATGRYAGLHIPPTIMSNNKVKCTWLLQSYETDFSCQLKTTEGTPACWRRRSSQMNHLWFTNEKNHVRLRHTWCWWHSSWEPAGGSCIPLFPLSSRCFDFCLWVLHTSLGAANIPPLQWAPISKHTPIWAFVGHFRGQFRCSMESPGTPDTSINVIHV